MILRYKTLDNKLARLAQQQTRTKTPKHSFYPRVLNMTDISFSEPEMTILQKGPKYNILSKPKDWLQTLALEAETAITLLPPSEREVYRKLTAERVSILQEDNKTPTRTQHTIWIQDHTEHKNKTQWQQGHDYPGR